MIIWIVIVVVPFLAGAALGSSLVYYEWADYARRERESFEMVNVGGVRGALGLNGHPF